VNGSTWIIFVQKVNIKVPWPINVIFKSSADVFMISVSNGSLAAAENVKAMMKNKSTKHILPIVIPPYF
jgi:hypothetical protein